MVKIFQGDYQTVQSDMNQWIEVYNPKILDVKQSVVLMEKEHNILLVITVLYESKEESRKVEYKVHPET